MSAHKETFGRTVGIVVAVCLACSIVVSTAAVGLRSMQTANAELDKQTNILEAAGLLDQAGGDVAGTYERLVEERFVDLNSGEYVEVPEDYDMFKASKDPEYAVRPDPDPAGIFRHASVVSVYHIKNAEGQVTRLVLPIYGSGLWNIMYGMLALDGDGNTTRNLVYYDHKETPGLGGEVQNPAWKAKWDGKKLYKDGELAIQIKKNANPNNEYSVDALSGATLTSNGVQATLDYWLAQERLGNFLTKQPWKS
ncbi:MAG: Na(+)-translocating NADH-quinone reductase subunit C [Aestuariibacter sp.]